MTRSNPVLFLACVVNDGDQPVTVLTNIEDYVAIHIVCIFEDLAHIYKIPPFSLGGNPAPGPDFLGSVRKLFFCPRQVLACDNVH